MYAAASSLIPVLGGIAAFLFVVSIVPQRSALTRTIQAMEARAATAVAGEQADVSKSTFERAVARVLSPQQADRLSRRLIEAGWYKVTPLQFVIRVIAAAILGVAAALVAAHYLAGVNMLLAWPLLLMLAIFIAYSPVMWLTRAVEHRKDGVQRALPDFLDMVASTVHAGLSLNAALAYSVDAAPGPLGDEVNEALAEIRLGRARAEALKAAADRVKQEEFSTTVAAINQAEKVGANIGRILTDVADDTRTHHILLVEEHAQRLPLMMAFPMGLLLIPALLIIIFGALAANYFAPPSS